MGGDSSVGDQAAKVQPGLWAVDLGFTASLHSNPLLAWQMDLCVEKAVGIWASAFPCLQNHCSAAGKQIQPAHSCFGCAWAGSEAC